MNLCTCSWYIKTCGRIYAERITLEGQNRYFDNEPCEYLEINEDDIKDLCDKMKK